MISILGIVTYKILPAHMGGQKAVHLFYSSLASITTTQVIGTLSNENIYTPYQLISFFRNSRLRYINPFLSFKLLKIIKKENPHTIIFEHPYLLVHQLIIKSFTNKKIIIHSHNIEYLRFKTLHKKWWWLLKIWEGISYKQAHKVFFITEEDQKLAIQQWHLKKETTMVVPYGINMDTPISLVEKNKAKQAICNTLGIQANTTIFFFNGTLNYPPNRMALEDMQRELLPVLVKKNPLGRYALIFTGSQATDAIQMMVKNMPIAVFFLGFVDDITEYYKGCDIFLNLVNTGGGIKTKLVEALGYGMNAVSYEEGAWGIDQSCVQGKLFCSNNIEELADAVIAFEEKSYTPTPIDFYKKYAWRNIALQVKQEIEKLIAY